MGRNEGDGYILGFETFTVIILIIVMVMGKS